MRGLPIAAVGLDKGPATAECIRRLLELGHRRIVLLVRRQHRKPKLGIIAQAFQKTLAAHGIGLDSYLLPDWEETVEGFQNCLKALFQLTPPTAIITDQPEHFAATYHFIAGQGLRVPQDVSLAYGGQGEMFEWCVPTVAHLQMDIGWVVRHAVRWTNNVSRGKPDRRQKLIIAKFVPGGTVAPPRDAEPKGPLVSLFGHR